ncbi:MAG: hypothetical protein KF709_11850 [Gemmatimonadaceae bacterium]|nr:hypothetical protein [Gemmatimonadaceae bacterium]
MPKFPKVDAAKLPATRNAYVAWIDVMGVQSIMSRSLPISANFILKFHAIALRHRAAGVALFPVMDGLYFTSEDQDKTKAFIREIMTDLADLLISETENKHRFLVRAGLAYGPVISGSDITKQACEEIHKEPDYARTLLMGIPMIQAHLGERLAAPFGCFVDDSARAFAPSGKAPFNEIWWSWFEPQKLALAKQLRKAVLDYLSWAEGHATAIGYERSRIASHRDAVEQYLPA